MTASRQQAVANALRSTTNAPRFCAQWTRTMFGVAALGDFDGDGAADAEDMWKAAKSRHPGDRNPPAGVPVYYGGGSADNGHISVSLGLGSTRSTDAGGSGKVATVPLDFPERQWGMPYLGWSDDLYGNTIPDTLAEIAALQERIESKLARRTAIRAELVKLVARVDRKTARLDTLKSQIVTLRAQVQVKRESLP